MEKRVSWVAEGLVTGLIGYVTVVVFFSLANLIAGEAPFHTVALLGSALFFGARGVNEVVPGPGPIIAYNGFHMLISLFIGMGAAWLVFETEKHKPLWFVVFFIFLAGFIYSVILVGILAAEIVHLVSWGAIVAADLLAGATAGIYLWRRHARLPRELEGED